MRRDRLRAVFSLKAISSIQLRFLYCEGRGANGSCRTLIRVVQSWLCFASPSRFQLRGRGRWILTTPPAALLFRPFTHLTGVALSVG
jgi:hypothetical protein